MADDIILDAALTEIRSFNSFCSFFGNSFSFKYF